VDRPRPFVSDPSGVHLFSHHAADAGFPSDHATASFAIAVALLLRSRRLGLPVLALAFVLSVGRVAVGVHYPSDVLAGAALGAATAIGLATPRLRRLTDRLADAFGAVLDAVAGATARRLGVSGHR
jgi:undecaprenyl-diphosphatase